MLIFGILIGVLFMMVFKLKKRVNRIEGKTKETFCYQPIKVNRSFMPTITNENLYTYDELVELKVAESLEKNKEKITRTTIVENTEVVDNVERETMPMIEKEAVDIKPVVEEVNTLEKTVEYKNTQLDSDIVAFASMLNLDLSSTTREEPVNEIDDKGNHWFQFTNEDFVIDNNNDEYSENFERVVLSTDDYFDPTNVDASFSRISHFYCDEFKDYITEGTKGFKKFVVQVIGLEQNLIHVTDGTARIWLDVSNFNREFNIEDIALIEAENAIVQSIAVLDKEYELEKIQSYSENMDYVIA